MSKETILIWLFIFVVLFAGFLCFSLFQKTKIQAATASYWDLSGWLWSSNIGWVSLDGFNCKVTRDSSTGDLSGYAWSSNIGWIKFDPLGPFPSTPNYSAKINFSDGVASGWIKATQADKTNGGWDGWIKITDAKIDYNDVDSNGKAKLNGWAWGDLVVGWLNFYDVRAPIIKCDFSANPIEIEPLFGTATLSWNCVMAPTTVCSIDHGVGQATPPLSGSKSNIRPTQTTTYTLSCPFGDYTYKTSTTIYVCQGSACPSQTPTSTPTPYKSKYKEVNPGGN